MQNGEDVKICVKIVLITRNRATVSEPEWSLPVVGPVPVLACSQFQHVLTYGHTTFIRQYDMWHERRAFYSSDSVAKNCTRKLCTVLLVPYHSDERDD
jgi:hypothetical protein